MCTACYALTNINHIVPIDTLRVIYFAHIHSIISYGIIFWLAPPTPTSIYTPKENYQNYNNTRPRDSCMEVFKGMEIMALYSQYIYSLVLYTIIKTYLIQIMKFINIKLGITIIYNVQ